MSSVQKPRPTLPDSDTRPSATTNRLLARLNGVIRSGTGWTARCPAHEDNRNSLSIHHCNGRWLLYCHAGCGWRAIIDQIGIKPADLFNDESRAGD
jgi:putative DNA primase/helicase